MMETPAVLTYASVVSHDTILIALTIAALHDLQVKTSDVENAFLTTPSEEHIWTTLGPKFGKDAGKKALLVHVLYGLKSTGGSSGQHLADCMWVLGYGSCKADSDLWYKPATCPDDGYEYYIYVLLYINDCLTIHHDAESVLYELDKYFCMKRGSITDPNIYLGNKL